MARVTGERRVTEVARAMQRRPQEVKMVAKPVPYAPTKAAPWSRSLRGAERTLSSLAGALGANLLAVEVEGALGDVGPALARLIELHPVLRCTLDGDGFDLGDAPAQPLREVTGAWRAHAEALLHEPRGFGAPAWQLVVVRDAPRSALLLAAHPALADGATLSTLLGDLLALITSPDAVLSPGELPDSALDLHSPSIAHRMLSGTLGLVVGRLLRVAHDRAPLRGKALREAAEPPSRFGTVTVPATALAAVHAEARQRGTSVGSVLVALAQRASRALAEGRGVPTERSAAAVDVVLDLRRPDQARRAGLLAGVVRGLDVEEADLPVWDAAGVASFQTRQQAGLGVPLLVHVVAERVPEASAWLASWGIAPKAHGGVLSTTHVSGAAVWTGPPVAGVWSGSRAFTGGPALTVGLCTVGGIGCLSGSANGAAVSADELQAWLEAIAAALCALAE